MTNNQSDTPLTSISASWPSPERIQHIQFEGCDCAVLAPEEYEALYEHARTLERALSAERAKNARLVADLDNAWEQFRRMRNLLAEAKYGDRLQNQVIAMKEKQ